MPAPQLQGIYPSDSVSEVAQSLPLDPLALGAAESLAGDIEYRIHLIVQEAKKFMVAGKRSTLSPEDVEYAMEALNVEPILIPPKPLAQPTFQPLSIPLPSGAQQTIYHVPDDEIDFSTYLKEPLPAGLASSAGVKWKAHWLAVEGVQPAIPENPAPASRAGPSRPTVTTGTAALRPSARSQLPQELQLYFTRLTTALIPTVPAPTDPSVLSEAERHRLAALESLRQDTAIGGILAYIVKWFAESIQKSLVGPTSVGWGLLQGLESLLRNDSVFLEPYLHQLLGPVMSVLLTAPLGPHPPVPGGADDKSPYALRVLASSVLRLVTEQYGAQYPGLLPRISSTLTKTLFSPPAPIATPHGTVSPAGRYEGAVLGLTSLGPGTIRSTLWKPEYVHQIDQLTKEVYSGKARGLVKAYIRAMNVMFGPKPEGDGAADGNVDSQELSQAFGGWIGKALEKKNGWLAGEMLRRRQEEGPGEGVGV